VKTSVNLSKKGNSIMLSFEEGFSTYSIAVPMPYSASFFLKGLLTSLAALNQSKDLQKKLERKEGQKAEILEGIRKAIMLYENVLKTAGR
jgi:hypothetical protein